jgi:hypothetical protein
LRITSSSERQNQSEEAQRQRRAFERLLVR